MNATIAELEQLLADLPTDSQIAPGEYLDEAIQDDAIEGEPVFEPAI